MSWKLGFGFVNFPLRIIRQFFLLLPMASILLRLNFVYLRREACCIFPTFQYPELINTIKSNSLTVKSVISTPLGVIENLLNSGWQRNRPCEWRNESWLVHSASRGVVHYSCGTDTTAVTNKKYTGHCFDGTCVFQN